VSSVLLLVLLVQGVGATLVLAAEGSGSLDPLGGALDHFYNLEYDAAQQELEAWLSQHPDDLRGLNYLASALLQGEMFRRELLESQAYTDKGEALRPGKASIPPSLQSRLFAVLEKVEQLADSRLKHNRKDEEALYWAGVSHVTRALFQLTLAKAHMAALSEAKQARKLHVQLLQLNPNFVDAYLVTGMYDYVVGSLPWYMKVLASLIGHRGDRLRGLASVKRVAEEGRWAREDAKSYLAVLYFRERRYDEALDLLRGLEASYPRNFLLPQQIARIHKAKGDWKAAAEVYDSILARYKAGAPGYEALPFAKVLFQAGDVQARLGERERALKYFEEAAGVSQNDIYAYRAELSAAALCAEMNRRAEAVRRYQRVANEVPATNEGKAAREALKRLQQRSPLEPQPGS